MSDNSDDTQTEVTHPSDRKDVPAPPAIGRYQVESVLGSGGFGTVFLAFDRQLLRRVAVKVPKARRMSQEDFCSAFLAEARTLARLDHPHIVPVYDVGSSPEHPCFIVSKYITGASLSRRMPQLDWSWQQRAELVAAVAEALHCAHLAGLIHRDVKPSNVLVDESDKPYLADFGLALSDEDYSFSWSGGFVGTLMYMSPEQVRGEAHLVDGRADVFSLGVLMYELLTGVRPFSASTREQVMRNILERDAKPLRQRNENVPRELERICLRALERRTSQRYSTALDFAEELRGFVDVSTEPSTSGLSTHVHSHSADTEHPTSVTSGSRNKIVAAAASAVQAPSVVPKGLRAFDGDDADFFLHILPGPKDRQGIPGSLRFWKHRIESSDPEETFRAAVIYGPSGCGKSSLVRAGLVPLLSDHVLPIVVSATPNDTEERLQRSVAAACPEVCGGDHRGGLAGMLHAIRVADRTESQRTVLLVIDQFEQWLSESADSHLIDALRQCDGVKLKCLFLVRNDFWMSISRVMEQLEAPIQQGKNSAAVELFDLRHAQHVLFAFGHAYGALPESTDELTKPQRAFLQQSTEQLAQDGRVICVRLAVYAQMIRDKTWEPKTLAEFGGVRGLGARFLEDTFYGTAAPPEYIRFQDQAREILHRLLPTPGSDIRGAMMSEQQLAEVVGQLPSDTEFKSLLRLLNDDLRLLTPTDALGTQVTIESENSSDQETARYYQLTHDYLVPSLRTWLNAKQRESAVGRAQLCLEDRTALWEINRESRQLPSWIETLRILLWTPRSGWTDAEAKMMAQAKRLRITQGFIIGLFLVLVSAALLIGRSQLDQRAKQRQANSLVEQLSTARLGDVLSIVTELDQCHPECDSKLQSIAAGVDSDPGQRLRSLLALSRSPGPWTDRLLDACGTADSDAISLVKDRIRTIAADLSPAIRMRFDAADSRQAKLRYAALLSGSDSDFMQGADDVVLALCEALVEEDPYELDRLAEHLSAVHTQLMPTLIEIFHDSSRNQAQSAAAARPLAKYADAKTLSQLILSGSASQHFILMPSAESKRQLIIQLVEQQLTHLLGNPQHEQAAIEHLSNGVFTLLRLSPDAPLISKCLAEQIDPSARTRVILQCHQYGVPFDKLWDAMHLATDPVARQALILASEGYHHGRRPQSGWDEVRSELQVLAKSSPYQSERSAAQSVLRRLGVPLQEPAATVQILPDRDSQRDWWMTRDGLSMAIVTQPVYADGPQAMIIGRPEEAAAQAPIGTRRFAISTTEVSRDVFSHYNPDFPFLLEGADDQLWPANNVWSVIAMRYCRWLSEQEEIPDREMCYPPETEIDVSDLQLSDEQLQKTSYRLPTEAEWEFACLAGTRTPWSHGSDESQVIHFGCSAANSNGKLFPVGSLLPNPWGLFDMHGNAAEWCHPALTATRPYAARGGNYTVPTLKLQTRQLNYPGSKGYSFTGFRVARTITTTTTVKPSEPYVHP